MNVHECLSHEQAIELLPWLVNDSLQAGERERVLEHARSCVNCRRQLDGLESLRDSIARLSATTPIPAPDMRNINARIDALIDRENAGRVLLSRLREFFGSPWRLVFVAQSILLLVLGAALLWPDTQDGEFTTLTQPQGLPEGHYLRVVFSPDLTQGEVSDLLDKLNLRIVHGPSSRGVYTLSVSGSTSMSERDDMASSLLDNRGVLFAEPVTRGAGQ